MSESSRQLTPLPRNALARKCQVSTGEMQSILQAMVVHAKTRLQQLARQPTIWRAAAHSTIRLPAGNEDDAIEL